MKKIIIVVSVLVLLFGVVGCDEDKLERITVNLMVDTTSSESRFDTADEFYIYSSGKSGMEYGPYSKEEIRKSVIFRDMEYRGYTFTCVGYKDGFPVISGNISFEKKLGLHIYSIVLPDETPKSNCVIDSSDKPEGVEMNYEIYDSDNYLRDDGRVWSSPSDIRLPVGNYKMVYWFSDNPTKRVKDIILNSCYNQQKLNILYESTEGGER